MIIFNKTICAPNLLKYFFIFFIFTLCFCRKCKYCESLKNKLILKRTENFELKLKRFLTFCLKVRGVPCTLGYIFKYIL